MFEANHQRLKEKRIETLALKATTSLYIWQQEGTEFVGFKNFVDCYAWHTEVGKVKPMKF